MRNSSIFAKITSIVLVVLVMATVFAACATPKDDLGTDTTTPAAGVQDGTTPADGDSSGTTPAETEPAYEYADVNYGGADFAILNAEDRYNMIYHPAPRDRNRRLPGGCPL